MNLNNCMFEKASNISVGAVLFLIGLGFAAIGITVLPVIGLIFAVPVLGLSAIFFTAQRSKECSLGS